MKNVVHVCVFALCAVGCSSPIEERVVLEVIKSCPSANAADLSARDRCARALAKLPELANGSADSIAWGAQDAEATIEDALEVSNVEALHPLVFRKLFLSTFMFEEQPIRVGEAGARRFVMVRAKFRHAMDAGAYPYPFWHSQKKWSSYQQTAALIFYFQDGVFVGALRSKDQDASQPSTERLFDGAWTWQNGQEPKAAQFSALFSANNPHATKLEERWRALAIALDAEGCLPCHSPDNAPNARTLEVLNYPNQALGARHTMIRVLLENRMPPQIGISDLVRREAMIELAKSFAEAGDEALRFERETLLKAE